GFAGDGEPNAVTDVDYTSRTGRGFVGPIDFVADMVDAEGAELGGAGAARAGSAAAVIEPHVEAEHVIIGKDLVLGIEAHGGKISNGIVFVDVHFHAIAAAAGGGRDGIGDAETDVLSGLVFGI